MGVASERVLRLAELLLGETPPVPPVRMELGYGNENWHLQLSGGRQVLIKIAQPGHPVPKAESASRAQQLAHAVGAPVAQEILLDTQCAAADGRIIRILEYLPGLHPTHVLDSTASIDTFFGSLGRAVAHLHQARCDGFASHVGGTPNFPTWSQYVAYRVPQIARRGRACTLLTQTDLSALLNEALELAQDVSAVVEPRLTHRDLYLDNLLAEPGGTVSALLDLDHAEAWDPVADFVKLQWQVFPLYPGSAETFWSAYTTASPPLPHFDQRLRIAQILELTNNIINAEAAGDHRYALDAQRQLHQPLKGEE